MQNEERQAALEASPSNAPTVLAATGAAATAGAARATPQQLQALRLETQYIELFLMKYICPAGDCNGTMAPAASTDRMTLYCNMCGFRRTEAEFLGEVEELMHTEYAAA